MFLASPGALEVIVGLTDLLIVSTDLTDVTLVSDDTYLRLDWCYSNNWGYWYDEEDDPGEWWLMIPI